MQRFVPGIEVLRGHERSWSSRDVVAGVVLTALLVPQGMAYAELAGLPAITGLYTSIMCLLAYAVFGPSRVLVLGPDSSLGPMIAATILPEGETTDGLVIFRFDAPLVFANARTFRDGVRGKVQRYGLDRTIDPAHFFHTIEEAVTAFTALPRRPS